VARLGHHRGSVRTQPSRTKPAVGEIGVHDPFTQAPGAINGVTVYNCGPRVGIIIALVVGVIQVICAFLLFRASSEPSPWGNPDASTPGSTTGPSAT